MLLKVWECVGICFGIVLIVAMLYFIFAMLDGMFKTLFFKKENKDEQTKKKANS